MFIYDDDYEDNDDDEIQEKAKSVPGNNTYKRMPGTCKRPDCKLPAAPHQVYCSREHSPYGTIFDKGVSNAKKQIYKNRPKKRKK